MKDSTIEWIFEVIWRLFSTAISAGFCWFVYTHVQKAENPILVAIIVVLFMVMQNHWITNDKLDDLKKELKKSKS